MTDSHYVDTDDEFDTDDETTDTYENMYEKSCIYRFFLLDYILDVNFEVTEYSICIYSDVDDMDY